MCRLIDELARQTGSDTFELPEADYYWEIPAEKRLVKDAQEPSRFLVGRLRDDWEMIQSIADVAAEQTVTPYSLTEVAPLLDYMGQYVVRKD